MGCGCKRRCVTRTCRYVPAYDWVRLASASGRLYYCSVSLGITSWDRPVDYSLDDAVRATFRCAHSAVSHICEQQVPTVPPPLLSAAAEGEVRAPVTGAELVASTVTSRGGVAPSQDGGGIVAPIILVDGLADDFVACVDRSSGATYWSSTLRRATAWSKPARMHPVSADPSSVAGVGDRARAGEPIQAGATIEPAASAAVAAVAAAADVNSTALRSGDLRADEAVNERARARPLFDATPTSSAQLGARSAVSAAPAVRKGCVDCAVVDLSSMQYT